VAVNSLDVGWPCAAGLFAADFRGKKPFRYGDVFTTDVPLASDTQMDCFLVFAQSILSDECVELKLNDCKVHFSQFYPVYRQELPVYEKIGLEAFWKHEGFDMYDIRRKPIFA
jgi:Suppressor of fused protein (SUFU)